MRLLTISLCVSLFWTGCSSDDGTPEPVDLDLTLETYPAVDGSTSAHPLAMLIACRVLGVPYTWRDNPMDGTKRLVPDETVAETAPLAQGLVPKIVHSGTHGAYVSLIEGNADLILVARSPSEPELQQATTAGVEIKIQPVALDAFVFIANHQNPVASLTVEQIQQVYTGQLTKWNQLGGPEQTLNAYQRNDDSGSQVLMKQLVMKEKQMIDAPEMVLMGMMGPINMISDDTWGLGYSVYFFEQCMAPNEKLKLLGIDGVVPSSETIGQRSYSLATEVYAAVRGDLDPQSSARKLHDWLLTDQGQAVVAESGYVRAR
jgi:phosphate transport system substrate-binding protein